MMQNLKKINHILLKKNTYLFYLQKKGQHIYGSDFKLTKHIIEALIKVRPYITNNAGEARKEKLNIEKGVFILGNSMVGKTSLMYLIKGLFLFPQQYQIRSCYEIESMVLKYGEIYLSNLLKKQNWCFDDFGSRFNSKHIEIMKILLYHLCNQTNARSHHVICKLTKQEIILLYGNEFYQSILNNFNVITIEKHEKNSKKNMYLP